MLAHLERTAGQHGKHQVQRSLPGDGVHFILEDAGKAPVLRGFSCHLDFAGNAVRDMTDQLDELGIGIFVAKVLWDKLFRHLRHRKYRFYY